MCEVLRKVVRALRECPHLRIEIWGTRLVARLSDVGHGSRMNGAPDVSSCRDLSNGEDVIFNCDTALYRYHFADGLNLIEPGVFC